MAFGKVIPLVGRHCCLRCCAVWVVTSLGCSCSPIHFMLQPRNTSLVRKKNFSHNKHQSEDEQRRDETRAGVGGVSGVCAATAEESLCCEELGFLSAAVRGKNTDQTIIVRKNVLLATVQILAFAAAVRSVSTYIMEMCRKAH